MFIWYLKWNLRRLRFNESKAKDLNKGLLQTEIRVYYNMLYKAGTLCCTRLVRSVVQGYYNM